MGLVDRLGRADVAELGRAVGRHDDDRHRRQPGLDDGRVEVGRRRPARAQQDGRRPAPSPSPSATNAADPLVVDDVHGDIGVGREGHRHRRAARSRATNRRAGTPWRTSSSTSVAQNVACTSAGATAARYGTGPGAGGPATAVRAARQTRCAPENDRQPDLGWQRARRGLVRRGLPVVLHRQAPLRGRQRPGRRPGLRRPRRVVYRPFSSTRGARRDHDAGPPRPTPASSAAPRGRQDHRPDDDVAAGEGLEFHLDRAQRAKRATPIACSAGPRARPPGAQDALKERLLGPTSWTANVGDPESSSPRPSRPGSPRTPPAGARRGDRRDELTEALRSAPRTEITAVPTYVFDRRWSMPGAQDPDVFVQVLKRWRHGRAGERAGDRPDATYAQPGAPRGPAGLAPRPRPRLHPDPALVGAVAARLADRLRGPGRRRCRARRLRRLADRPDGAGAEVVRTGGAGDVCRLLDGRPALPARRPGPPGAVERLVLIERDGGHRRRRRAGRPPGADEALAAADRARRRRRLPRRWLAQPLFATAGGGAAWTSAAATPPPGWRPACACRHRHPGPAVGPPGRADHAGAPGGRRARPQVRRHRRRMARRIAGPCWPSSTAPATPRTWSSPTRSSTCSSWLTRSTLARPRASACRSRP